MHYMIREGKTRKEGRYLVDANGSGSWSTNMKDAAIWLNRDSPKKLAPKVGGRPVVRYTPEEVAVRKENERKAQARLDLLMTVFCTAAWSEVGVSPSAQASLRFKKMVIAGLTAIRGAGL